MQRNVTAASKGSPNVVVRLVGNVLGNLLLGVTFCYCAKFGNGGECVKGSSKYFGVDKVEKRKACNLVAPVGWDIPANQWLVKTIIQGRDCAWNGATFYTNTGMRIHVGAAGERLPNVTFVAGGCRQIHGLTFPRPNCQPDGVREHIRPNFETPQEVQYLPAGLMEFGSCDRTLTAKLDPGVQSCAFNGDPHFTSTFSPGPRFDFMERGVFRIARGPKVDVQVFLCPWKMKSDRNSTVAFGIAAKTGSATTVALIGSTFAVGGVNTTFKHDKALPDGTYMSGDMKLACINTADGSASIKVRRRAGQAMHHDAISLQIDAEKIENGVGLCTKADGDDKNTEKVTVASEVLFTKDQLDGMNRMCGADENANIVTLPPDVPRVAQHGCEDDRVPYDNAVAHCRNFKDDDAWFLACIVEYCANDGNAAILEYMPADMDDQVCLNAKIAFQQCEAKYKWRYKATTAVFLGRGNGEVSEEGATTLGWYICEERCALEPTCRQVVYDKSTRRCYGYSEAWVEDVNDMGGKNFNFISAQCHKVSRKQQPPMPLPKNLPVPQPVCQLCEPQVACADSLLKEPGRRCVDNHAAASASMTAVGFILEDCPTRIKKAAGKKCRREFAVLGTLTTADIQESLDNCILDECLMHGFAKEAAAELKDDHDDEERRSE
jgi:hypothetical protein